ncbi:two-component system response regulator NarL [Thiothrix eikelboomii]|uniref:Two component transcriptional regulator, LuxR family n=1 Tax=Thiothrix eikelboomii TaxID=92487 RepID=A0A1T4W8N9_9GAMM|nr:two-component system response regulator NarL [Thiothrix eikelboomii]SKA73489.1 two component transcriptional regulator, LuxR family [Thiothrix eikelboomii]
MLHEYPQSLLIVDDHPLFRKGVRYLVNMVPGFTIIGEASNGQEGIDLAQTLAPDMILLDLHMKDMSGIDVLKVIKASGLDCRVVMLTVSDQTEDLVAALRAGADGYLLKEMEPEDLVDKLAEAAAGQIILTERMVNVLAHAMRNDSNQPKTRSEAGLTDQEQRILELVASGKSNKLVARELNIAEGTVKVHVKHLLRKLNLRSRLEVVVWYAEQQK